MFIFSAIFFLPIDNKKNYIYNILRTNLAKLLYTSEV